MISVNNKFVSLAEAKDYRGKDPLMIFVRDKMEEIKSLGDTVTFKLRPGVIKRNKLQGLKEGKKPLVSMVNTIQTPRGSETWLCADSTKKHSITDNLVPIPKHIPFGESKTFNTKTEMDRILYFMVAAPQTLGSNPLIIKQDLEKEAKADFEKDMPASEVKLMLYRMEGGQLIKFARACGISNPESLSPSVLKSKCFQKIEFDDKRKIKSFEEYLQMGKDESNAKILASITEASDRRIIAYSDKQKAWGWLGPNETWDELLLDVPAAFRDRKESLLAEHLSRNVSLYTRLATAIKAEIYGQDIMGSGKTVNIEVVDDSPEIPEGSGESGSEVEEVFESESHGENIPDGSEQDTIETPEGEMTIAEIQVYFQNNDALPFMVGEPAMNRVATIMNIPKAGGKRTKEMVYDDIKEALLV